MANGLTQSSRKKCKNASEAFRTLPISTNQYPVVLSVGRCLVFGAGWPQGALTTGRQLCFMIYVVDGGLC